MAGCPDTGSYSVKAPGLEPGTSLPTSHGGFEGIDAVKAGGIEPPTRGLLVRKPLGTLPKLSCEKDSRVGRS